VRKRREGWFLIVLIVILIALIFLAPSYGWKLRTWLSPQSTGQADDPSLAAQNEALEAQIAQLESVVTELPTSTPDYVRAMVYSRYPLNFKNEILVNAGTNEGVAQGDAVVFQGILIGTVENVFADSALVQTVFDSGFRIPVRVGTGGYDALFTGGTSPLAASIQKSAPVAADDIVYAAAPRLPYGLPMAVVESTTTSPDNLFEEANLSFAYDINAIETVLIAK